MKVNERSKIIDRVDFTKDIFDNHIYRNSVLMSLERALFCPCRNIQTNYINQDCPFCKGTGWLYSESVDVYGMITSLTYQQTLQMTYEEINATANLTLSEAYDFRLRYFDKLTIKDGIGLIKNTNVVLRKYVNEQKKYIIQATTPFKINEVEYLILLTTSNELIKLTPNDYSFFGNIITLSDIYRSKFEKQDVENWQASIRYYHFPIYHVLRDEHAIRMSRIIENRQEIVNYLPLQYIIREHSFFTDQGIPI